MSDILPPGNAAATGAQPVAAAASSPANAGAGGSAATTPAGSTTATGASPGFAAQAQAQGAIRPEAAPPTNAAAAVAPTAPASPVAQTAQVAIAAAQAALASSVNLSTKAQQAVRVEAFTQLVAQLVQQIGGTQLASTAWPANGVSPAVLALLSGLVQQGTAGQALPQQLVSAQAWPQNLLQAVLQQAGQAGSPSSLAGSGNVAMGTAGPATIPIPALQNWLVLQGSILAQDGTRGMSLTLKVPAAWAQAQAALGAALPGAGEKAAAGAGSAMALGFAASPGGSGIGGALPGLQLAFAGSVQQLASTAFGLVLQPQALPGTPQSMQAQLQMLRTSAILQLELQPLPTQAAQQAVQAVAAYTPAQLLPQEWQAWLQGRVSDPWVQMAQMHANGQQPRQQQHAGEQAGLCVVEGCQYLGRAVCAQPFCAEMNYLWSVARAQSRI